MRQVSRSSKNNAWNEVVAIILLGVGTLLFLALISYHPKDLRSWVPWSYLSPPNRPAQNFVGPFGAIFAGFCYLTLGAASYFLAGVLLFFGAGKLFHANLRLIVRLPWIILFIASGACLLQLQTSHLRGWRLAFNIQGPGGWVGYVFGKTLLLTSMGKIGSIILLSAIYVASLILMTGLRPIHLVQQSVSGTRPAFAKLYQWRLHRQLRKADIKGQLEISRRELAKQRRSIEKQLKKKGAPVPEPGAAFISPEELADRPAPKVVDATALPEESIAARKKPSLAELRGTGQRSTSTAAGPTSRSWDPKTYALPGLDLLAA